ncbi:MAG: hypothetical protein FJZ95_04145 [Chloroflexi bacterium]|nr:hypothetical protein [Chloroflexota bacterium]
MTNLVVAFAEVGGQWQGYAGPNALALTSLENGKLYWWYATQEMTLDTVKLYKGWNNMMWLSPSAPVTSALAGKEASILFVVVTDIQSGKNYLYQSPQVKPLSVIPVGQKYSTFVAPPGNLPQMATKTR